MRGLYIFFKWLEIGLHGTHELRIEKEAGM
jgi:hypothetical protein